MNIEIRGEEAIEEALYSMKSGKIFLMFGINYKVSRVVVEYREISEVVFAQVEFSRLS